MVAEGISVSIDLPYPISMNRIWRSGNGKVYRSDDYKRWINEATVAWYQQRPSLTVWSVSSAYTIEILARPPDARQRDLGNLEKVVSDFLQYAGIIANDCLAEEIHMKWDRSDNPSTGVTVTVTPFI